MGLSMDFSTMFGETVDEFGMIFFKIIWRELDVDFLRDFERTVSELVVDFFKEILKGL